MAKRSRKRMSKQELAAPDEIEVALNKVWDALYTHKKWIVVGFAGLLAIGVALWIVNATSASAQASLADDLRQAVAPIGAPVGEEEPSARELPGPKPERFADKKALIAAGEQRLATYIAEHEGDDTLELVELTLANLKLQAGDRDGALALVETWLGAHEGSPARSAALDLKARALAQGGDSAKAIDVWTSLAEGAGGKLKALALKMVGDLSNPTLSGGGDAAKAREAYEKALEALGPAPVDDATAAIVGKPGLRGELENHLALLP